MFCAYFLPIPKHSLWFTSRRQIKCNRMQKLQFQPSIYKWEVFDHSVKKNKKTKINIFALFTFHFCDEIG